MTLGWIVAVPVAFALAAAVSSPRWAKRIATGRNGRLRKALADAVGGLQLVRHVVARPRRYPGGVAGFPLFWLGQLATLYAALRAFTGSSLVPAAVVLAFVTGYVVTALPLPAGGAGSIEASLAVTLHLVGVPLAAALLGALVYRFFTFWLPLGPALALLPALRSLDEELPKTRRSSRV
jgi:uncharacterized membrane protein YbhN (UPF0104 family)